MLTDFHIHTTYCDGNDTPEEIIRCAIDRGFSAIGFSGHGYTGFDITYCMKETDKYIAEITALREKYKNKIKIYLGIEEDCFEYADRSRLDYIIGSKHYFHVGGEYLPIDESEEIFEKCVNAFGGNPMKLAEAYYDDFCGYIMRRKPDIIGHFDLITKFEETGQSYFFGCKKYREISRYAVLKALSCGCVFEVNTGAIARKKRTTPYPDENILYTIKQNDGKIILSSDCHDAQKLGFRFDEAKSILRDIGFTYVYTFDNGLFVKEYI